jgi:CHAT domain-containing protein/tetratricopeptide (TPR) repeat protein
LNSLTNVLRQRLAFLSILFFCLGLLYCEGLGTRIATITSALTKTSAAPLSEPQQLNVPGNISAVVSAGEVRVYAVNLSAGQHAHVEIRKGDLQLRVSLCAIPNQSCLEVPGRRYGTLRLSFSADVSKAYRIEVKSIETEATERTYELQLAEIVMTSPQDRLADEALRAMAEGDELQEHHIESAQITALSKYNDAIRLWKSAGEVERVAETLRVMGDVYFALSQYQSSLAQYEQALSISEAKADEVGVLAALDGIGYTNVYLGENQKALSYAKRMLDIIKRIDPTKRSAAVRRMEARALNTTGEADYSLGELRKSIELFERAYSTYAEIGERAGQALGLLNLGYSHSDLGNVQKASEYFERALTLFQTINDGRGAALAQTVLGGVHSSLGEEQTALDLHKKAGDYFRAIGNKQGEAAALNGIARAYQNLNEFEAAFDNYSHALHLYEAIGNRDFVALNKFLVGRVLYQRGETTRALKVYHESLELSRRVGDRVVEAHAMKGLGTIYFSQGDDVVAVAEFNAALEIYRKLGNRRSEAYVLNDIGHIQAASHKLPEALATFQQALLLMRDTRDRHGEVLTLFNTASAERDRGNLSGALSLIQDAIAIGESLRTKVNNSQLRTSYFASIHEQYELYIDVLMRLHNQFPDRGFALAALLASERARARSLLDSLLTEKIESRGTPSADLLSHQQELLRALDEKAEYQTRLLAGKHTQEDADKLSQELDALTIEYQSVRAKLRVQSPRRGVLIQSDQLRAEDLQSLVNGNESVLLEFSLGDEHSYLWVLSGAEITSYELPGRATIEALGWKVYDSLTVRQSLGDDLPATERDKRVSDAAIEFKKDSAAFSKMLLGQVASRIGTKRLLIVADGVLRYIPFEALPMPDSSSEQPLVSAHEIVMLPSAMTLMALRSEKSELRPPNKAIAVIADPVFEKDDPRVLAANSGPAVEIQNTSVYLSTAMRDFSAIGAPTHISRLPSTLREAKAIMAFVHSDDGVITTGFEATKQRFVSDRMSDYRILHVATHGLLNVEHPNLSGVILSMVDEHGRTVNGFLRMHDIYGLNLSADLVVLSACRTGLGKSVHGEGMVGLPSGFMYAGAKSVVASLWKVDDNATAEFMTYFYAAMLRDGLPPATALRIAKLEMQKQPQWREPFFWAGFVLQGEYRKDLDLRWNWKQLLIISGVIILLAAGIYYGVRRKILAGALNSCPPC